MPGVIFSYKMKAKGRLDAGTNNKRIIPHLLHLSVQQHRKPKNPTYFKAVTDVTYPVYQELSYNATSTDYGARKQGKQGTVTALLLYLDGDGDLFDLRRHHLEKRLHEGRAGAIVRHS